MRNQYNFSVACFAIALGYHLYLKVKNTFLKFALTLPLSVIFFMSGLLIYGPFFKFCEPGIEGISFQITDTGKVFQTSILFSLVLALIPVLIWLTWRLGGIVSAGKKAASLFTVLAFAFLAILARRLAVKTYFNKVVKPAIGANENNRVIYPINPVNFVYFILAGLIVGCVVSYLLFRKKKYTTLKNLHTTI